MLSGIQVVKRNVVKALAVRTRCPVQELPSILGENYQKIMTYMGQMGGMAAGAPYVAYFNQDMNDLEIEIGIPVAMYMPDKEDLITVEIPEGEYLRGLYTGPYSGLKEAYGELTTYMTEKQLVVNGVVYESYLNDPANTPEDKLMTEILFKL